jgi:hypothetical protein
MATDKPQPSSLVSEAYQDKLGPDNIPVLLEQYKLYLKLADKISERRQHANEFFLTVNTGLCAFFGYLFSKDVAAELRPLFWCVPVAGILLSYFWYRLVSSYRTLNSAKFSVVHEMETLLPLRPYDAEWDALGRGESKKYVPFTHLEVWVPRCFILMYFVLIMWLLPWTHWHQWLSALHLRW